MESEQLFVSHATSSTQSISAFAFPDELSSCEDDLKRELSLRGYEGYLLDLRVNNHLVSGSKHLTEAALLALMLFHINSTLASAPLSPQLDQDVTFLLK